MVPSRKKKKLAQQPLLTLAQVELEDNEMMDRFTEAMRSDSVMKFSTMIRDLRSFFSLRSEQIKALLAEVENLSDTLASFKELDEIKPLTACHSTQTSHAPSCKETSSQTDPTKPATPAPTKRKQTEAPYPPSKRTNLKSPAKPAPSRVPKPAAAQVVLHGEKSAAHTVVVSDDPQADPREIYKAVRAAHTLPQGVWASLHTKGKLVLHSSNPDIIPEVTTSLASKLTGMTVRQQKVILPRICLFKVDEETSNSTIEETLLGTPAVSQLPGDKVVRVAHRSAPRNGTCTAFIEVDLNTFRALGIRGRIVVDGVILNFEESIRARICFRCCGFGHNSAQCTRDPKCFHCGEGGHEGRSCPSVADRHTSKCTNCCTKGLQDKHEARASSCPTLKLRALKKKKKESENAEKPIITLAQLEMENEKAKYELHQVIHMLHPHTQQNLHQFMTSFVNLRTEQIKTLIAEVENLSGTLESFKELDEIKPPTACHSTQTSPSPSCKETSSQTDPTKPATPAPTKRKQTEAPNPPAKRTNLRGPAKPAPSRLSKPAAAQVVLHGEKSAAHTVVISDDPQADPRAMLKAVRAAHTLPQGVWASLRTKGKLVLHSSNPDTIPAVTTSLANKLDGMKVRQQKVILPRICLFKVDEETSNSTIEETLLETPAVSQLLGDKVVRVAHRSAPRNGTCTAFIEVDLTTFRALGSRGRIVVDGVILNFEESIRARICFRCCGFGHNSAQCTRDPKCFHCGEGGHD
ncbi:hypothetical protein LAZ67_1007891, partial [Cordylochernes scorpioides]